MQHSVRRRPLSLARRFLGLSFLLLLLTAAVVGSWSANRIEELVVERTAAFTSLYVDTYISHYVGDLEPGRQLTRDDVEGLDRLFRETALGREIVSLKIWTRDKRILYSTQTDLIGRRFGGNRSLDAPFDGEVVSRISNLQQPENAAERRSYTRLLETYAPVRTGPGGEVVAVSEFYQLPHALEAELRSAQRQTWLLVAGSMLVTFALLGGLVVQASGVIARQQSDLHAYVEEVQALNDRVHGAVSSASTGHETMLRRISADLHDGPAQDLAVALLRLEPLLDDAPADWTCAEATSVHQCLSAALTDLRGIAAGLTVPDLSRLTAAQAVERAAQDHCRRHGALVRLDVDETVGVASLPVLIAAYRIVQESLRNASKHGLGHGMVVRLRRERLWLRVEVEDDGPGFDPSRVDGCDHLGLSGMRDRAESLGGRFVVESAVGRGTVTRTLLPMDATVGQE